MLVAIESEQAAIERARTMRPDGSSFREIANTLNADGVQPETISKVHSQTVSRVLAEQETVEESTLDGSTV